MNNIVITISAGLVLLVNGCTSPSQAFKPQVYPCVIGCGNDNLTPPKGYCYYGGKLMPLSEFYEKHR